MRRITLALALLLLSLAPARAEDDKPKRPPDLDDAAMARLVQQKVLIGRIPSKQVFSPYIGSKLPVFVTSDSILHPYHVLLEESVVRLERRRALELAKCVRHMLDRLRAHPEEIRLDETLVARATDRARRVLQVALGLLGEKVPADVAADVRRVEAAEGLFKPAWLGPPDAGFEALDYGRFKPISFYASTERLQRYYRAVAWLQAIPFRAEPDEELVAFLLVQRALNRERDGFRDDMERLRLAELLRAHANLVGSPDDPSAIWAGPDELTPETLRAVRAEWRERRPGINDQVADPPPDGDSRTAGRTLPAARVPDAVLFHRMMEKRIPLDGLQLCAALGSKWTRGRFDAPTLETIDVARRAFGADTLYADYLRCVATLLDEPDHDAPAFMGGEPWRIKSCHTVLGGWAQLRHTWALQAKTIVHYLGMANTEPGYVEPDPEFFARLAGLAAATHRRFDELGVFDLDLGRLELGETLQRAARVIENAKLDDPEWPKALAPADIEAVSQATMVAYALGVEPEEYPFKGKEFEDVARAVGVAAGKLLDLDRPIEPALREIVEGLTFPLGEMWRELERVCHRLESLAHRQLRGVGFTDEERRFLEHYGKTLAGLVFYGGNSYLNPRDDAPRATSIAYDPVARTRRHVAVGRPRPLYVLYPTKAGEVLCRGAVMTYYEFDARAPLTDAEWKAKLDGDARPAPPPWLEPARIPGGPLPAGKR